MPVYVHGIGSVQAFKIVHDQEPSRRPDHEGGLRGRSGSQSGRSAVPDRSTALPGQRSTRRLRGASSATRRNSSAPELDLERYSKLIGSGFESRQSVDQQKAITDALKGRSAADQAAIETAKLNLRLCRHPLADRRPNRPRAWSTPATSFRPARTPALVTITQTRPIFVNFTVPQDQGRRNPTQPDAGRSIVGHRLRAATTSTVLGRRQGHARSKTRSTPATGTLKLKADVREHRRAAVAGRVRQRPPGTVQPRRDAVTVVAAH